MCRSHVDPCRPRTHYTLVTKTTSTRSIVIEVDIIDSTIDFVVTESKVTEFVNSIINSYPVSYTLLKGN